MGLGSKLDALKRKDIGKWVKGQKKALGTIGAGVALIATGGGVAAGLTTITTGVKAVIDKEKADVAAGKARRAAEAAAAKDKAQAAAAGAAATGGALGSALDATAATANTPATKPAGLVDRFVAWLSGVFR